MWVQSSTGKWHLQANERRFTHGYGTACGFWYSEQKWPTADKPPSDNVCKACKKLEVAYGTKS